MRFTGVVLVIIGLVALVSGGLSYNRQTTLLDVGGFKATATEHKSLPVAPLVGAMVMVVGIALVIVPGRRAG
jgi:uncharacterized membrane protein YidH (DUF202 family)